METPIQILQNEITTCQKDFSQYITERIDRGDITNELTPDEWLNEGSFDDPTTSTAWESGYLQGLKQAMAYFVSNN